MIKYDQIKSIIGWWAGVYEDKDCGVKNYPRHHPFLLKSDELSILTHFVNGPSHKLGKCEN